MTVDGVLSDSRLLPDGDEAGTPPADRSFRPDVQGLRAIAVGLVVFYHADSSRLTGGYVGVDVFFVISGFVITGLLLRERMNTKRTSMLGFYARRARRILPAATLVILATVIASYWLQGFLRGDEVAVDGRWAAVFLANFHFAQVGNNYLGALGTPSPLLHYWSLSVEEQFYLVFPLLFAGVAAVAARRRSQLVLPLALGAAVAASFAYSVIYTASNPVNAFFSPFTRAWELALGGLVAVSAPALRRIPPAVAAAVTWLGIAAIGYAAVVYSGATAYPGSAAAVPVLGAALVIAGGLVAPKWGAELLLGSWLFVKVGEISYALYLWHYPLLILAAQQSTHGLSTAKRLALVAVAVVLAVLTRWLIENPIRHARGLVRRPALSVGIGAGLIAATLAICSMMIITHSGAGGSTSLPGAQSADLGRLERQIAASANATRMPAAYTPPLVGLASQVLHSAKIPQSCVTALVLRLPAPPCVFGDLSAHRTMVILGDSQAMMWSSAFLSIASSEHWRVVFDGMDACPPWYGTHLNPQCAAFHKYSLWIIHSLHPALVVVTGYPGPGAKLSNVAVGMSHLLSWLRLLSAHQVVLGPIPWFTTSPPRPSPPECLARNATAIQLCSVSTAQLDKNFGAFAVTLRASAAVQHVRYVPVRPLFCTETTCPTVINRRIVYQDRQHITRTYSAYVAPALASLLGPVLSQAGGA